MNVGLFYNYAYSGGSYAILPTTVKFDGYSGSTYSNTVEARAFNGGQQFYAEGWISWSESKPKFSFSSLTIEADLSAMPGKASDLITYQPSFGSAIGIANLFASHK